MCGIAGILNEEEAIVDTMVSRLTHRGPDGSGVWKGSKSVLGHTRLSIIDLEGGAQPMNDKDNSLKIVYNGEIYNFLHQRSRLGEKRFLTTCDTEVILELFKEDPGQYHKNLDGMFAFAIMKDDELFLGRDPLGIKPLYLGRRNGKMIFASEIKALLGLCDNIEEFPPGHVYSTKKGFSRYYNLIAKEPDILDFDIAKESLLNLLVKSVRKRLMADVPVGVFLSGGLDSSVIAAIANIYKKPLDTFSVGTSESRDRKFALQMAEHLGTRHHEYVFTIMEAIEALPEIIYHLESFDCALVRSAIPNYFLARLASQHVKVALSGEGADELFSGYHYLKGLSREELEKELLEITSSLHNTNLQRCDRMSMAHGLEVRVPFLDVEMVDFAFRIPVQFKLARPGKIEKWILRKAAESLLPSEVAWRPKVKFAQGAGLDEQIINFADQAFSNLEFKKHCEIADGITLKTKEELFYYRIFKGLFPEKEIMSLVGYSKST